MQQLFVAAHVVCALCLRIANVMNTVIKISFLFAN